MKEELVVVNAKNKILETKVVINNDYGGYSLSDDAILWLMEKDSNFEKYKSSYDFSEIDRHNPLLVQCVEELGSKAAGCYASLQVVSFSGDKYIIEEYDGCECVVTPKDIKWIKVKC